MVKCEIIKDILPLYVDNVCSAESRELVEEHISACESCKAELENMQSEVKLAVSAQETVQRTDILKSIKKKFFKKKIAAVSASVAASIALLVGIGYYVFLFETVIPYEEGLVNTEIHRVITAVDAAGATVIITETEPLPDGIDFVEKKAIDVSSAKNTHCVYGSSRYIEENGQTVNLVYINFSETLSTKLDNSSSLDKFVRMIEPQPDDSRVDIHEMYYLNTDISAVVDKNDFDYAKAKEEGTFIWRGKLD